MRFRKASRFRIVWLSLCDCHRRSLANNVKHVVCDGNLFVGLPRDYEEGRMAFESTDGRLQVKG